MAELAGQTVEHLLISAELRLLSSECRLSWVWIHWVHFWLERSVTNTWLRGLWEQDSGRSSQVHLFTVNTNVIYIYTAVAGLQGEGGPNIQKHLLSSGRLTKYSREGNPGKICTKQETVINSVWQAGLDLNADSNRKCSFISETSQYREKKQVLYF